MDPGEQTTGTRDEHYDLVSVLYHALQGTETTGAYVLDAEASGDERLVAFFREAHATHRRLAERAKRLLGIGDAAPEADSAPPRLEEISPGIAAPSEDVAPPEEAVPPDVPSPPDEGRPPGPSPYRQNSPPPP